MSNLEDATRDVTDVRATAERWLAVEPDDDIRAELQALIDGPAQELAERFDGHLTFGTAGLRAEIGGGPLRMNRLVVRQAAAGLADYLRATNPDAPRLGVVIGRDGRRKSDVFAADTAQVLAAKGFRADLLPGPQPTPVLSWTMMDRGYAAGIVVTASHNPAVYNGYKVYLGDGPQIMPPADTEIAARIGAIDPATVELAAPDDPRIGELERAVIDAYVAFAAATRLAPDAPAVPVAYTPMHGVGGEVVVAAFEAAGLGRPAVVAEQFLPDAWFPTVAFPNPEEPGAMDLVLAVAARTGAVIALANDPDADRLGAAIPTADGSWRRLGGDEIGWLLADHILTRTEGDDRLVVTTLVSSSQLAEMAAAHGVNFAETYTGFKWIGHAVLDRPNQRFVFGYEQALGYLVAERPLDKDGISAAVVLAEIAAVAVRDGVTIEDRLRALADRFGGHVVVDRSIRMDPADAVRRVDAIEADPPAEIGGVAVATVTPFPDAGLVRFDLVNGVRLQVRPSGTEPKVKLYGEGVGVDPAPLVDALGELIVNGGVPGIGRDAAQARPAGPAADSDQGPNDPNWRSPASPRPGTMNA